MIPSQLLDKHNASLKSYPKEHILFNEGDLARYYFQIAEGDVKMFNLTEDGKSFVQGYFGADQSFGEPPLFGAFKYPAGASCVTDCKIYQLPKAAFFELLKNYPEIHLKFTRLICKRMIYKAKIMKEVSIFPPEHRIMTLLKHLKGNSGTEGLYEVNLTRQQISELTGMRVETVIRAIKKLEKSKKLSIIDRKVFI